jgi:AraC-like DNA-binding protein
VQRFINLVDAGDDRPVATIALELAITPRALSYKVRRLIGTSPHQYRMTQRMDAVRRALAAADPTKGTVTRIATDHGFTELGRFAVRYRQMFGECPSETLRRHHGTRGP